MEHAAAIDVPGMEAAGISLEDFVYYHCRVHLLLLFLSSFLQGLLTLYLICWLTSADTPTQPTC